MASEDIFNQRTKEEVIAMLDNANLAPELGTLIRNDDDSYELLFKILSGMKGSLEERVVQINNLFGVIRSTGNDQFLM
jgi:hypothetical protein